MKCDFCSSTEPVFMYAHPRLESATFAITWNQGHVAACLPCAELLELGALPELVERVLANFQMTQCEPLRKELTRFYREISPVREPLEDPAEYRAKHPNVK